MDPKNYICEGNKFAYNKGYIGLPVAVTDLPETVELNGAGLHRKTSFHVSLVCVKDILAQKPDAEQTVLEAFCAFTAAHDISLITYTGEFRFAQHEERKSLVALCDVSNLKRFTESLSEKLGIELSLQPTHVTLFTLQPDTGIGLNSAIDMESKSVKVEVPEKVRQALNF